jgi:hypothetical protein
VFWFVHQAWFPVIEKAINQLPAEGEIRSARLDWRGGDSPVRLAENPFLALSVDLDHTGGARSPADVQVEFGRADLKILSLFGSLQISYPPGWRVAFNRGELAPWWGAWGPPILAIIAGSVFIALMASWLLLAAIYTVPAWLIGLFANRDLSLGGSWRLSGAALMPGALLLFAAILFYGFGLLDLLRLIVAAGAHLLLGWIYIIAGPLALPRVRDRSPTSGNPFGRPAHRQPQSPGAQPGPGTEKKRAEQ